MAETQRQPEALEKLKDLAGRLDVSERTIRRWIKHRGFPHLQPGGEYRFRPSEVDEWMEQETTKRRAVS